MNRSITSTLTADIQKKGNYAMPHGLFEEKHKAIPWEDWSVIAAMGGIVSSPDDMAKWMIFNLNNGIWKTDTLLTPQLRNTIWTPHSIFTVNNADANFETHFRAYGLGWDLSDYHGRMRVGHTGGYSGMLSIVAMIPDEKLGVVVLTNGMKGGLMHAVANYTIDKFLKLKDRDWNTELLERAKRNQQEDTRISDRIKAQVKNTKPSVPVEKYVGQYLADIYGKIEVKKEGDKLRLSFEHSNRFNATLEHWHYDVWKIKWDNAADLSWFHFATVRFEMDNNLNVTGLDFDVPNDDIWFYELKPRKIK